MSRTTRAAAAAIMLAGAVGVVLLTTNPQPVDARQAAGGSVRLALINGDAILAGAPGKAAADSILARAVDSLRAEVKRMGDSLDAMMRAYESVEATLSPPAREQRRKAIQDTQIRFEARRDSLSARAQQRQSELLQPILDLVNRVLQEIRDENGYTLILDLSADGHGIVAYDKNLDITDRVIARVRREPAPAIGRGARPPGRRGDTAGPPFRR